MTLDSRIDARVDALLSTLAAEAADAFNRWLALRGALYNRTTPIRPDQIEVAEVGEHEWFVRVDGDTIDDYGRGLGEPDPVRVMLRFIAWATEGATVPVRRTT